ncbi:MAG: hypothetical protein CM1200mP15_07730 [Dehalococcoidia bacterium]|nr:MAG: hypothetical protein CM1200mP15_07730 [Dehalococcoidia bacterium]
MDRRVGEDISINVPKGTVSYRIEKIGGNLQRLTKKSIKKDGRAVLFYRLFTNWSISLGSGKVPGTYFSRNRITPDLSTTITALVPAPALHSITYDSVTFPLGCQSESSGYGSPPLQLSMHGELLHGHSLYPILGHHSLRTELILSKRSCLISSTTRKIQNMKR